MRNTFANTLYEYAKSDPRIITVAADISPAASMAKLRDEKPEQFINVGVAEQSMIGICAGLALKGCRPFAYTIATFALYRPFEMVRVDLCYQNLPVTIIGMGGGLVYSGLGSTHHTQEDIAIAGCLPNMTIVVPCDPLETQAATRYGATENMGPLYMRLGKAGEQNITEHAIETFKVGKIRYLSRGEDICIISYGLLVAKAQKIAARLEEQGLSVSVVSNHTLKPLDAQGIKQVLKTHKYVVVMEEHVPSASLSWQIKNIAWDMRAKVELVTFTLRDEFIHYYGTHDALLARHGISEDYIYNEVLAKIKITA